MATKKQKRAIAEANHEAFMAEYRRSGLEAQKKDRAHREAVKQRAKEDAAKSSTHKTKSTNKSTSKESI